MTKSVRNCIVLTVDCLRADHVGVYGYPRQTTPFLDSLAKKSVVFENFFSNGPFTPAAMLSLFASAYPLDFGGLLPVPESALFLPQHLSRHGIASVGLSSNAAVLHDFAGYDKGFEKFELLLKKNWQSTREGFLSGFARRLRPRIAQHFGGGPLFQFSRRAFYLLQYLGIASSEIPGEDAFAVTEYIRRAVAEQGEERFFLWAHYIDPHLPRISEARYEKQAGGRVLAPHRRKFLNSLRASVNVCKNQQELKDSILTYDAEIAKVDAALAELWKALEASGRANDTAVIITADHGEELFEHNRFWHDARFYEPLLHIPCIMHVPGAAPTVSDQLASSIDIAPTVCELLGAPKPDVYRGRSLGHSRPVVIPAKAEIRGVRSGRDPYEERPIIAQAECDRSGNIFLDNLLNRSKRERREGVFRHAIRSRRYKYIWDESSGAEEWYDLAADPQEMKNNLELREAPEMQRLMSELREFRARQKATVKEKEEAYMRYFFTEQL